MTYDDYGHHQSGPESGGVDAPDWTEIGHHLPSGGQQLPGPGFYEISGLAWSGGGAIRKVEISTDGGQNWKDAELRSPAYPMAHTRFGFHWNWDGKECVLMSRCTDELGRFNRREPRSPNSGTMPAERARVRGATTPFNRGGSRAMGACTMGSRRFLACVLLGGLLLGVSLIAQSSPTYGVGRRPPQKKSVRGISRSVRRSGAPAGTRHRQGRRAALRRKGCAGCHGANGTGGRAPELKSKDGPSVETWKRGRILPVTLTVRDDSMGLHQSRDAARTRGIAQTR